MKPLDVLLSLMCDRTTPPHLRRQIAMLLARYLPRRRA